MAVLDPFRENEEAGTETVPFLSQQFDIKMWGIRGGGLPAIFFAFGLAAELALLFRP